MLIAVYSDVRQVLRRIGWPLNQAAVERAVDALARSRRLSAPGGRLR
ncbi:hypothetical protein WJ438_39765 [Streptomyces sp. GD-15H]